MRRISRTTGSIDLIRASTRAQVSSPYLCLACRHQSSSFSTSTALTKEKSEEPLTQRLRKKIWGTDQPPGQEDPYGDGSVFDRTKKRQKKLWQAEKEEELLGKRRAIEEEQKLEAEIERELDANYEPAQDGFGLDWVGGPDSTLKEELRFRGFMPSEVIRDPLEMKAALHRAMVEVFALKEAGHPLNAISNAAPGLNWTDDVQITPSDLGATLQFAQPASLQDVVGSLLSLEERPMESEEDVHADRSQEDSIQLEETVDEKNLTEPEEPAAEDQVTATYEDASVATLEEAIANWDPLWLNISLEDPEVKFAVIKRVFQLTGFRLPDSAIRSSLNVQKLLSHLIATPKPAKLVDALVEKQELLSLPNVQIYPHKITPHHKEVRIGRWKLIEKELAARGLPLHPRDEKKSFGPE